MKRCYLAFELGSLQKIIYPLMETTTIGRGSDNSINLADPTISRNHAQVLFRNGNWTLEDLGSANGTMLGGKPVGSVILKSGGIFQIGSVAFHYLEKEFSEKGEALPETLEILTSTIEEESLPAGQVKAGRKTQRIQDAIATIPFFSALEEAEHKKLVDTSVLHVVNAGDVIMQEGDPGRSIFVILDGRVRVFTTGQDGEELELAILGPSQFFGEMSLLQGKPRSRSVVAIDSSLLVELSFSSMRKLVEQHPSVRKTLLEYYDCRVRDAEEKRAQLGMVERRGQPRLKDRLIVSVAGFPEPSREGETNASSFKAVSENISTSGIVIKISGPMPVTSDPDRRVSLEIELPEPWKKCRTVGAIRRIQPADEEREMTLVAIEFVDMPAQDAEKLAEYIYGKDRTTF
jgi:CRP-like cAMP-binding protein